MVVMVKNDSKMLISLNKKPYQSSCQTILTLSESYYQTRVNTFSEFISNITGTLRKLLPNNTTHVSRHQVILTFSRVTPKQYCTLFQISSNTEIFRELLANNTTPFSRVPVSNNTYIFRELLPN